MSSSTPRTHAELRASIERRPATYFGSDRDLLALVQPLLSGRTNGPAESIDLSLRTDGSVTLTLDTPSFASLDANGRDRLASDDVDVWSPGHWLQVVRAASSSFELKWRDSTVEARFTPDPAILTESGRPHGLLGYLRDLATAHAGLRARFVDEGSATSASLHFALGARDRLDEELAFRSANHAPIRIAGVDGDLRFDVAFAWCCGPGLQFVALVNGERTANGGTHVLGVWEGIAAAIEARLPVGGGTRPVRHEANVPRNAVVVVSVHLPEPSWGPATKDCLHDRRAREIIARNVARDFVAAIGDDAFTGTEPPWQPLGGWHLREPWLPRFVEALERGEVGTWEDPYVHRDGSC